MRSNALLVALAVLCAAAGAVQATAQCPRTVPRAAYNTTLAGLSAAVVGTRGLARSQFFVTRTGDNGAQVVLGAVAKDGSVGARRQCVGCVAWGPFRADPVCASLGCVRAKRGRGPSPPRRRADALRITSAPILRLQRGPNAVWNAAAPRNGPKTTQCTPTADAFSWAAPLPLPAGADVVGQCEGPETLDIMSGLDLALKLQYRPAAGVVSDFAVSPAGALAFALVTPARADETVTAPWFAVAAVDAATGKQAWLVNTTSGVGVGAVRLAVGSGQDDGDAPHGRLAVFAAPPKGKGKDYIKAYLGAFDALSGKAIFEEWPAFEGKKDAKTPSVGQPVVSPSGRLAVPAEHGVWSVSAGGKVEYHVNMKDGRGDWRTPAFHTGKAGRQDRLVVQAAANYGILQQRSADHILELTEKLTLCDSCSYVEPLPFRYDDECGLLFAYSLRDSAILYTAFDVSKGIKGAEPLWSLPGPRGTGQPLAPVWLDTQVLFFGNVAEGEHGVISVSAWDLVF